MIKLELHLFVIERAVDELAPFEYTSSQIVNVRVVDEAAFYEIAVVEVRPHTPATSMRSIFSTNAERAAGRSNLS